MHWHWHFTLALARKLALKLALKQALKRTLKQALKLTLKQALKLALALYLLSFITPDHCPPFAECAGRANASSGKSCLMGTKEFLNEKRPFDDVLRFVAEAVAHTSSQLVNWLNQWELAEN